MINIERRSQHETHMVPTGPRVYPAKGGGVPVPDHDKESNLGAFLRTMDGPALSIDLDAAHGVWLVKTMGRR